jgi:DeoR family fructose operon transcriptional repressor
MTKADGAAWSTHADQRYQRILLQLREQGRIDASDMAAVLGVTGETLRKDLIQLERHGRLRRIHGGAVPPESLSFEPAVATRVEFAAEKTRIARAALAHLPDRGSVLIDAGSTAERFSELFPGDRELTVFTNTLPIALTLVGKPLLTVFTFGGRLRGNTLAEVDDWALRSLAETNVDVAFLGTNGISLDRGLTTPDPAEASVKRAMLDSAQRRILLCDHSKFGVVSTAQHATLADIDLLITDSGIGDRDRIALVEAGVDVELA